MGDFLEGIDLVLTVMMHCEEEGIHMEILGQNIELLKGQELEEIVMVSRHWLFLSYM